MYSVNNEQTGSEQVPRNLISAPTCCIMKVKIRIIGEATEWVALYLTADAK